MVNKSSFKLISLKFNSLCEDLNSIASFDILSDK